MRLWNRLVKIWIELGRRVRAYSTFGNHGNFVTVVIGGVNMVHG